ncbi:hypothetical protein SS50377_25911 [Spironucleus salmonicida]|uniref:Uncharacterized protein n=1 Tax=Spironucleus salmonicida TaxID=348837 RepID=V6M3G9_9EUKA|nr:hypothetical protein SS50377_25908 [Spironucleus salmonicida]KAH0571720.1 hypothetical protein SS50377_25911 [Spironucleus salmonicida]|eukprot:EST47316.1 Hypothetical protein SS50377_12581 [Spironucleus salmonicida]
MPRTTLTASTLHDRPYLQTLYSTLQYRRITEDIVSTPIPQPPYAFHLEVCKMQQMLASSRLVVQRDMPVLILLCEKALEIIVSTSQHFRVRANRLIPQRGPHYVEMHTFCSSLMSLILTVQRIRTENQSGRVAIICANFLRELRVHGFDLQ